jgi:hypothetical protein
MLSDRLGRQVQLVTDRTHALDEDALNRAVLHGLGNAAPIEPAGIGTVSATLRILENCRAHGWGQIVWGWDTETNDTFLADLAVATGCGQLKAGAPTRGESVAKYNRLLELADQRPGLPYGASSSPTSGRCPRVFSIDRPRPWPLGPSPNCRPHGSPKGRNGSPICQRLVDRDYAAGAGMRVREIENRWGHVDLVPGVESAAQVARRARAALDDHSHELLDTLLILVTHRAVIRQLLAALDPTLGEPDRIAQEPGCWNMLLRDGPRWLVVQTNQQR